MRCISLHFSLFHENWIGDQTDIACKNSDMQPQTAIWYGLQISLAQSALVKARHYKNIPIGICKNLINLS